MTTLQTAIPRDGVAARGIGFAVLSYASFSTADAIIKLASARFSVFQIAFTVAAFALLPVLGLTQGRGGWRALLPQSWPLVVLRGALTAVGGLLAWQGFSMLPLSEVYAILFAAPILVTVLSVLVLREDVGWRRWSAQAAGFVGVLIMIRPDFATLGVGHLLTALAAVLGASALITLKKIGGRETSAAILFAVFVSIMLASAPMVPSTFVMPEWRELGLLALAGLLMGCGQAGLVLATREAPAVVVAPFQYSQMIWGVLFGAVLFGDRPAPILFVGMAVVVASGLYTIWREIRRDRPVTLGGARGEVAARAAR
ncbi:MAG: DMT family transporter [Geminicoccaceae bacterium]